MFGEMHLKLKLIVANLQMHWPTLPPKGSVIIAQSDRLRYTLQTRTTLRTFE